MLLEAASYLSETMDSPSWPDWPNCNYSTCGDKGFAHVYIDWSNISIRGKKAYSRKASIKEEDGHTIRYDIGALKAVIIEGFGFDDDTSETEFHFNFYGSQLDSSNEVFHSFDNNLVRVVNCPQSSKTGREKQVDTSLAVEMAVEATEANHWDAHCVFAMVSGDADMVPAVEKAVMYGHHVYIWSWRDSLAQVYTDLSKKLGLMIKICLLDDHLEKLTRVFPIDQTTIPQDSTVVLTTPLNQLVFDGYILSSLPFNHWKATCTRNDSGNSIKDTVFVPLFAPEETPAPEALLQFFQGWCSEGTVLTYGEYCQSEDEEIRHRRGILNAFSGGAASENSDYGSQDDQKDGFTVVDSCSKQLNKRMKEDARKSAKRCYWRKYCRHTTNCKYHHTEEETEFFNTSGHKKARKHMYCDYGKNCIHGPQCYYAHTEEELFCPTCGAKGEHEMKDCLERNRGL
ncbi:hypothetical protein NW762_011693 [Fusarium torreyae]|uniref:NYN domain-containing protein n=1 Tax=Fusarium torreyae TaxID=1237075 RepID=A0A9W8RQW2_9HYPO|nr:hypothetical protein NW762_011693 [Fusarium torreyae]